MANYSGQANDADDHIVYEKDTGFVFFDADGNGTADTLHHFATLDANLALTSANFHFF